MVEILKGQIPEREGLREVLEIVTTSKDVNIGILYISGGEISGRIGIAWGRYLTGAILDSGEAGRVALRKLLLLRAGTFRFVDTHGEPDMDLRQSLGVDLNALVPYVPNEIRPTVTPFLFETAEIEDFQRIKSPAEPSVLAAPKVRTSMADLASAITDITEDNAQLLNSVDLQSGLTLGDELRTAYEKAVNTNPSGYQEVSLPKDEEVSPSLQAVQPMIDITKPAQGNQVVDQAANVVRRIDNELGTNATTGIVRPPAESLEPTIEIVKPKSFEPPTTSTKTDVSNEETQPLSQAQVIAAIENSKVIPTPLPEVTAEAEPPAPMSSLKKPFTRLIGAARDRSRLNAEAKLANSARAAENEAVQASASVAPAMASDPAHESVVAHEVENTSASVSDATSSENTGTGTAEALVPADLESVAEDTEPVLFTAVESKADILRQARKEAATFLAQETRAATHLRLKPVSKIAAERAAMEARGGDDAPISAAPAEEFHTSFDFSPTLETDNTPIKPSPFNVKLPLPPVPSWLGATDAVSGETTSAEQVPVAEPPAAPMNLQERLELDTLQAVRAIEIMQEQSVSQLTSFPELEAQEEQQWQEPSLNSLFEPPADKPSGSTSDGGELSRPFDISDAVTEAMRSFKEPDLPSWPNVDATAHSGSASEIEWESHFEKVDDVVEPERHQYHQMEALLPSSEPHMNVSDLRGKRPVPPVPGHPFLSTIHNRKGEVPDSELAAGFPPIAPHFELPELIPVPGAMQLEPPGNIPPAPISGDRGRGFSDHTLAAPAESSMLRTIIFCLVLFVLSCVATVLLAPGLLQWVTTLLHR